MTPPIADELRFLKEMNQVPASLTDIDNEIAMLEDAINRNPIKNLIDAGLNPAIVEDLEGNVDPYSFRSMTVNKLEDMTKEWNPTVKKVGKAIYMAHDTPHYKLLSELNRWSDFVARYTLYQHLTKKEEDPSTHEDAVMAANDVFVNYDMAMPK